MKTFLLGTVILVVQLTTLPVYAGKLPYFYSHHAPSPRVVTHQKYWPTHGSSHSVYKKDSYHYKLQNGPAKPFWGKIASNVAIPSSFELGTKHYEHGSTIKQAVQVTPCTTPEPKHVSQDLFQQENTAQQIDYPFSALIHQLDEKLQQVKQQLTKTGGKQEVQIDIENGIAGQTKSKPDGKSISKASDEPFWIALDVVNKREDQDRLVKSIKVLLESLNDSTTPKDSSTDNVYDLIDIRSSFHNK